MKFSSVEEMVAYIENAQSRVAHDLGEEMTKIMREEVQDQVYNSYSPKDYERTMQLLNSPQIKYSNRNSVCAEFMMVGDWKSKGYGMSSYKGGGSPFFPMYGLEDGGVWARGATNIMDGSYEKIQDEIPKCYKNTMNSMGIPVV